jgi:hypothetical protein
MDKIELTQEEITRYQPYHTMQEFWRGRVDYLVNVNREIDGVAGQAYDRGAECAMRRQRKAPL